uniref:Protein FAM60A-like n=1 Tax=Sinocyclocheilus grahami TaxID=75366 RepID=A0A672KHI0_SINGR
MQTLSDMTNNYKSDQCNIIYIILVINKTNKFILICVLGISENYSEVQEGQISVQTSRTKPAQQTHNHIFQLQNNMKYSDAHSTTSSASPAQSPSYSNQSDEGSDSELTPGSARSPVFSFLDLTYWKRQRVCCGIIYKGRFGEVLIDPHLYKPCCQKKQVQEQEEEEEEEEDGDLEKEEVQSSQEILQPHSSPQMKMEQEVEEEW